MTTSDSGRTRVVHVSSAHRVSDVRIHLREASTMATAGYRVHLIAVAHDVNLQNTGVQLHPIPARGRAARVTLSAGQALFYAVRLKPRVIHLHDPELLWAIRPLQFIGIKVVYDAHEDLPVQVLSKPYIRAPLMRIGVLLANTLVRLAQKADLVVVATDTIAKSFPSEKVVLVRNYPVLRDRDTRLSITQRKYSAAYIGVLSETRGINLLVNSLTETKFPPGWNIVVAGKPSPEGYLRELQDMAGWDRVDYKGLLSTDEARNLLTDCRVGIVTLKRTQAYMDSLPTKMFEYFAAGMPVIASDFPLWRSIVEEYECGILVDEESPREIAAALAHYASNPKLLEEHGANARRAALNDLNWKGEGQRLLESYMKLLL